jgi:NAD(P)-dependent dehydrogenase (short-subunit alcohol dehydrogenase family)
MLLLTWLRLYCCPALQDVRHCFSTNVMGPIFLTQALLPHMKRQRRGTIVNISAVGGVGETETHTPLSHCLRHMQMLMYIRQYY